MKKILAILLTTAAVVFGLTGCSAVHVGNSDNTSSSAETDKEFADWDENDILSYFKNEGVFTNDDYAYIQTGTELPDGITACVSYMDDFDDAYVVIFYFDADSTSEKTEEIYNEIKTNKTYEMTEAGGFIQPFNALAGRFAFFYSGSLSDEFVSQFETAFDKLIADNDITPDFYDKDLDLSAYEDDEDMIEE